MKKLLTVVLGLVAFAGFSVSTANAKTLKCQTVISAKADEVKMLKDFGNDVTALTGGSLKFEIMPAGTVVGVKETLDAVDKGLIDCGFAWTHYWSGEHPAAMLFGSPVAGAGVGIDNILPCSHIPLPPHSLQWYRLLPCSYVLLPLHSYSVTGSGGGSSGGGDGAIDAAGGAAGGTGPAAGAADANSCAAAASASASAFES